MKTRLRLFSYFSDNNQPEDDGPSSKLTIKGSGVLYRQRAPKVYAQSGHPHREAYISCQAATRNTFTKRNTPHTDWHGLIYCMTHWHGVRPLHGCPRRGTCFKTPLNAGTKTAMPPKIIVLSYDGTLHLGLSFLLANVRSSPGSAENVTVLTLCHCLGLDTRPPEIGP
ncbi:hypothetical protein RRG08_009309 [Elysia crispata]|uniref:Uncharacterized protein n=1 Tax=Elysia crispata TaxID=231223 RepID=A0AAE0XSC5_9GAST|nr:hypothetical protein RRG08_009309 [Elysia crispata]